MTSHRFHRLLWLPVLAAFLLAAPVQAQDRDADERREVVIYLDDADPIVIVDGEVLSDAEAEAYLKEHDVEEDYHKNVLWMGPRAGRMTVYRTGGDGPVAFFGHRNWPNDFTVEAERGIQSDALRRYMERVETLADREWNAGVMAEGLLGNTLVFDGDGFGSMRERVEIARMEQESHRLAREALRAEGAERNRLEQELRQQLNEVFDRKQDLRQEEIERLRQRMDEVASERDEREQARQEIIDRRLRKLLGETDLYDW